MHTDFLRKSVIAATLILVTITCAGSRLDKWRVIGPGGGGAQFTPTISPHDSKQVLVACDMTGAYLTRDGGASWRMFNLRGRVQSFAYDPKDPDCIYARTSVLWRSTDGGVSWNLVYPDPSTVAEVEMSDDHAGERIITKGGDSPAISAIAIDPSDPRMLYGAFRNGNANELRISKDWGKTWDNAGSLSEAAKAIYVDGRSPEGNRSLYVVGARSIARRTAGQWHQGSAAPEVRAFADVSLGFPAAGGAPVVYAVAQQGLFVSTDGGASWARGALPGAEARFIAVATCRNHPDTAYVSYNRLVLDGETWFGVARTADRGKNWTLVWKESSKAAENIADAWITERYGPSWGENPLSLGVSPDNPELCYGTDYGRTLKTSDGGKKWQAVYSSRLKDRTYTTVGLDVTTCYGVHFDPFDPKRIFISYTDIGLFRSENGGQSWTGSTHGVPERWINTTYWVVFDPEVRGRMWGVMSGVHDLPRPKMWRQRSPENFNGGVCISEDGGRRWNVSAERPPEMAATHILLDPRSPSTARTLYVAAFGKGVYKSTDGGRHWSLKNSGMTEKEPFAWRLAQDSDGVLYLVVARRSEDGSIGNDRDGALYRSTDGAETWTRLTLPEGTNGPNGLAIDPENPRRLYLAAWGRRISSRKSGGGIFLTDDAGASWRQVLDRDQHVYDVTVDPANANTLYACGFESSAWRSVDRGASWGRIRGYNFKWGHRVFPDPADHSMIYITTYGGSVWHGPAEGDPSAQEDIATPVMSYR